jgi:uncharacterized protein YjgD (DUF1641 family)
MMDDLTAQLEQIQQKLDYLTERVDNQCRRSDSLLDLQQDLIPVANDMFRLTIKELDEIDNGFTLEDVLFLFKRLLRDTRQITDMLDRVESTVDLVDELNALGRPVLHDAIQALDRMERRGYFAFFNGGQYVLDRIVTEFDENDLRALGDNVVTILSTIRNMTQPDMMALANNMIDSVREEPDTEARVSMWRLVKELNDPQVRRGMVRLLHMVRSLSEPAESAGKSVN